MRVPLEVGSERLQSLWRERGATLPLLGGLGAAELPQTLRAQPGPAGRGRGRRSARPGHPNVEELKLGRLLHLDRLSDEIKTIWIESSPDVIK